MGRPSVADDNAGDSAKWTKSDQYSVLGRQLWMEFDTVIFLEENMRHSRTPHLTACEKCDPPAVTNRRLLVTYVPCQKQSGGIQCGDFAIAFGKMATGSETALLRAFVELHLDQGVMHAPAHVEVPSGSSSTFPENGGREFG